MKKYMDRNYRTPKTFEDFVYVSQVVQAEGIRRAIEAQRRSMPLCMGSLYWQLNDVWQGASWSSIDNLGRWKALHFAAKEAYGNVMISPVMSKDTLKVHVVNDEIASFEGELVVQVLDFAGKTLFLDGRYVTVKENSANVYYNNSIKKTLDEQDHKSIFVLITFRPKNRPLISRLLFLVPPKDLNLEKNVQIIKEVTPIKDGFNVRISSPSLLKNVYLNFDGEGELSDNYFDVLPNQTYNVFLKTKMSLIETYQALKIKSLVDTY